jgi:signal transduction histidine kinase
MISLKRMRVSTRLVIVGLAVLLGLALVAGYTLEQIRTAAFDAHKARLKDLVEVSKGIIGNYQKLETNLKLTREEAQQQAKEALRSLRFGNDDYFFLYNFDGLTLMVAGKPSIEGQVLLGKTDAKGFKLWDTIVEVGTGPGKGYIEYWFPRAGQTEAKPKLSYLSAVPEWRWIVGTGVYVDDVDAAVKDAAIRYALMSLIVLAVVAALGFLVSRSIVNQLGGEPREATESMKKIANGDLGVEIVLNNDDSDSLMASLKLMQMKLKNITSAIQENTASLDQQIQIFTETTKTYSQTKTDEDLHKMLGSIQKLWKIADILGKSVSRFKS